MPSRHNPLIHEYLTAFRAQLHGLSEAERDDLVLELEDHILARLAEGMVPTGELLAASAAAHAASSAARAAQSAAQAGTAAKVTDLAAVRAAKAAARAAESALPPPAEREYSPELIAAVLEALGTPEELARRYVGPPPRRGRLRPRLARLLVLIMGIGLLVVALAGRYALEQRAPSDRNQITDPALQQQYLDRLAAICAAYRMPPQRYVKMRFQSRIFGRDCGGRYRVFHFGEATRLASHNADGMDIRFDTMQTVGWKPSLRCYELRPPDDIEGSTFGPSLLFGLLRGKVTADLARVRVRDVQSITVTDSEVTYQFTGAYFGYGDGEYTIAIDPQRNRLRHFALRRLDVYDRNRSRYYREVLEEDRDDLPMTAAVTELPIPADAERSADLVGHNVRREHGWKGQHLLGKPMPGFRMADPRTGQVYTPESFRGRPVLLVVAATWIPWDRLYLAALADIQRRYAATGLQVVVLAPEVDRRATDAFMAMQPLPYPFLTDFTGWEPDFYRQHRFYASTDIGPTFLAIDRTGTVAGVHGGFISPVRDSLDTLTALLTPALGEATVTRVEQERRDALAALPEAELLARAEACYAREDDFNCKAYLLAAIAQYRSLPARLRLCRLYTEYRTDEGKQLAEDCLAETTASPYPYLMLGDFYRTDKRNWHRAAGEYAKALQADSQCWLAYLKRGQLHAAAGELEPAAAAYRAALRIVPEHSYVWSQLAEVLSDLERHDETLAAIRQAQVLRNLRGAYDDYLSRLCFLITYSATMLGDYETAGRSSRQVLVYDPDDIVGMRDAVAVMVYDRKRPAEALPLLDRMLRFNRNGRDYGYYGSALDMLGRRQEAVAMFQQALQYDPSIKYTWMNLGLTYEHLGDTANARAAYAQARALFPEHWQQPAAQLNPSLVDD